jgi:hypothetical protein
MNGSGKTPEARERLILIMVGRRAKYSFLEERKG